VKRVSRLALTVQAVASRIAYHLQAANTLTNGSRAQVQAANERNSINQAGRADNKRGRTVLCSPASLYTDVPEIKPNDRVLPVPADNKKPMSWLPKYLEHATFI